MVHPLSAPPECEQYLNATGARIVLTLDAFYVRFAHIKPAAAIEKIVLARIPDYLSPLKAVGFAVTKGRKIPKAPPDGRVVWWKALMDERHPPAPRALPGPDDPAAILFSGGTSGAPKGIVLSNRNFIAEGMQVAAWGGSEWAGRTMLAILPIFHGFGLGVCVNATLMKGGRAILAPIFTPEIAAKLIRRKRPHLMVGVPTLYDALTRDPSLKKAGLDCLRAAYCGADKLPRPVKEGFEKLVAARGGNVKLREGYGLTEAVSAIMAMPLSEYREGSIGVPLPDMLAKICKPGTVEDLPPGSEGEICLSGPSVMTGYLNDPEATAAGIAHACRWPRVAAYRRSRPHGRGWLLLFHRPAQADDQAVGLQRLPGAGRGGAAETSGRAPRLRGGRTRCAAGRARQGFRCAQGRTARHARDGARTDRLLPGATYQMVLPAQRRIPVRIAENPRRQSRLPGADGRGSWNERGCQIWRAWRRPDRRGA